MSKNVFDDFESKLVLLYWKYLGFRVFSKAIVCDKEFPCEKEKEGRIRVKIFHLGLPKNYMAEMKCVEMVEEWNVLRIYLDMVFEIIEKTTTFSYILQDKKK